MRSELQLTDKLTNQAEPELVMLQWIVRAGREIPECRIGEYVSGSNLIGSSRTGEDTSATERKDPFNSHLPSDHDNHRSQQLRSSKRSAHMET